MAFPNPKFTKNFFKVQRKSPFETLPVHSKELELEICDVVQVLDSLYAAYGNYFSQYTISIDN